MKNGELIVANKKEISIKNMGYILKQARLKMGYTRDQLSERVGISHRYLTAIENEDRRPVMKFYPSCSAISVYLPTASFIRKRNPSRKKNNCCDCFSNATNGIARLLNLSLICCSIIHKEKGKLFRTTSPFPSDACICRCPVFLMYL